MEMLIIIVLVNVLAIGAWFLGFASFTFGENYKEYIFSLFSFLVAMALQETIIILGASQNYSICTVLMSLFVFVLLTFLGSMTAPLTNEDRRVINKSSIISIFIIIYFINCL